jgi:hypothetical protein
MVRQSTLRWPSSTNGEDTTLLINMNNSKNDMGTTLVREHCKRNLHCLRGRGGDQSDREFVNDLCNMLKDLKVKVKKGNMKTCPSIPNTVARRKIYDILRQVKDRWQPCTCNNRTCPAKQQQQQQQPAQQTTIQPLPSMQYQQQQQQPSIHSYTPYYNGTFHPPPNVNIAYPPLGHAVYPPLPPQYRGHVLYLPPPPPPVINNHHHHSYHQHHYHTSPNGVVESAAQSFPSSNGNPDLCVNVGNLDGLPVVNSQQNDDDIFREVGFEPPY